MLSFLSVSLFQFLLGRLETRLRSQSALSLQVFQFLLVGWRPISRPQAGVTNKVSIPLGRLETMLKKSRGAESGFQFLLGRLRPRLFERADCPLAVSIPLR